MLKKFLLVICLLFYSFWGYEHFTFSKKEYDKLTLPRIEWNLLKFWEVKEAKAYERDPAGNVTTTCVNLTILPTDILPQCYDKPVRLQFATKKDGSTTANWLENTVFIPNETDTITREICGNNDEFLTDAYIDEKYLNVTMVRVYWNDNGTNEPCSAIGSSSGGRLEYNSEGLFILEKQIVGNLTQEEQINNAFSAWVIYFIQLLAIVFGGLISLAFVFWFIKWIIDYAKLYKELKILEKKIKDDEDFMRNSPLSPKNWKPSSKKNNHKSSKFYE